MDVSLKVYWNCNGSFIVFKCSATYYVNSNYTGCQTGCLNRYVDNSANIDLGDFLLNRKTNFCRSLINHLLGSNTVKSILFLS